MERPRHDVWITIGLAGISAFGLFNIIGIRPDLAFNYCFFLLLGWITYYLTLRTKLALFEQNYKLIYTLFVILLIGVFILGDPIRGSRRWIDFGFFRFQVSEFFKPFFLIAMASILSSANRFTPRKLIVVTGLFLIPFLLIFKQPDLGTALLYLAAWVSMFYFSGLSTKLVVQIGLFGTMLLPLSWFFLKEYQKARVIGFINPDIDPQGLTYNLNQAIISVGSGGVFGKGMGLGTQARFRFLPEFHTDFAFASLIEQFGFIGGAILLLLYCLIMYRLIKKVFVHRENAFYYLFCIGASTIILAEIAVNIGMNMGLLPVTGIALPFISYGGSSILSTMIILGLVSGL